MENRYKFQYHIVRKAQGNDKGRLSIVGCLGAVNPVKAYVGDWAYEAGPFPTWQEARRVYVDMTEN